MSVVAAQGYCGYRLFLIWQQLPARARGQGDRIAQIVDAVRSARGVMSAEPVRRLIRLLREGAGWLIIGTLITWVSVPLFMLCILAASGGA